MKALRWAIVAFSAAIFLLGCQTTTSSNLAPDFTLPDSSGNMVHLADELQSNQSVVLVFYMEHT